MTKVLFAASEMFPLAKTGGLADVAHALPKALARLGVDMRVVMPAYRGTLAGLADAAKIVELTVGGQDFTVWEGSVPGSGARIWLAACAALYDRAGDPYHDAAGEPWGDNAWRFGCFSEVVARLAAGECRGWRPEVVHCNDWQTGLVPAWLSRSKNRPRTVFTIHNMAYQGYFGRDVFDALRLPAEWWSPAGVEFHGGLSCMKAGLVYADVLTTVSASYAREIQTPEFGYGLEGVLASRPGGIRGILNGIDTTEWDPASDHYLAANYTVTTVAEGKRANKRALQEEFGLEVDPEVPLIAFVGRLTHQKGTDLILEALPQLLASDCQLVVLGAGDRAQERAFADWARRAAGRVGAAAAYDERLAHRIEAGADLFLMPSRFEPCGLNQMYSQRYGTVPVVRRVGGLADTVIDADAAALAAGTATGVTFERDGVGELLRAVERALQLYASAETWRALRTTCMRRDFSWARAAAVYERLYAGK